MPDGVRVYMFYSYTGDSMGIGATHTLIDMYMCIPTDTHPNADTYKRDRDLHTQMSLLIKKID